MSAWRALLRREWLEHRAALLWAPLGLAGVAIALGLFASTFDLGRLAVEAEHDGDPMHLPSVLAFLALPFVMLYLASATFVLLGALYDERQDRSVLFWKSQPVTDLQAVLSKLLPVVLLAPLVTIAAIFVTQLVTVVLITLSCNCGTGVLGNLAEAGIIGNLPRWIFGFLTQALWSLPIWSWLLLVSAAVSRLPVLWAIGVPAMAAFLEWLTFDSTVIAGLFETYMEPVALVSYLQLSVAGETDSVTWAMAIAPWGRLELWLGLALSAALLAAAVYCRRRNGEL
jgi:ABC-2 type transport system permease protein